MLQVSFPLGSRSLTVYGLTQYDYGQELEVHGLPLPAVVECQISLQRVGGTTESLAGVVVDDTLTLAIPDTYLAADTDCDYTIYVYIYVTTEASGTTVYLVSLPVTARSMPEGYVPGETSPFAAVIEEITELVEEAQDAATLSESYAKGGTGTRTGEDTDNSKYYSEEARDAEAGAADSAAEARASEVAAAGSASTAAAASTSAAEAKTAAEAARDTATAKATEAANSASAAGVSAAAASASETAAGAYASTAGASAVSAASSASAAESSATSAASSASSAESSATAAAAAKQDALTAISGAQTTAVGAVAAEGTTQVAAVTAEGTAQKAAVQAKGAEVIASIPSDYSELSADVSSLKSDLGVTISQVYDGINRSYFVPSPIQSGYISKTGSVGDNSANARLSFFMSKAGCMGVTIPKDCKIRFAYYSGTTNADFISSDDVFVPCGAGIVNVPKMPATATHFRFTLVKNDVSAFTSAELTQYGEVIVFYNGEFKDTERAELADYLKKTYIKNVPYSQADPNFPITTGYVANDGSILQSPKYRRTDFFLWTEKRFCITVDSSYVPRVAFYDGTSGAVFISLKVYRYSAELYYVEAPTNTGRLVVDFHAADFHDMTSADETTLANTFKIYTAVNNTYYSFTDNQCKARFVEFMNEYAQKIGMTGTTFTNASGLLRTNVITAQDELKLCLAVAGNNKGMDLWSIKDRSFAIGGDNARTISVVSNVYGVEPAGSPYKLLGGKGGSLVGGENVPFVKCRICLYNVNNVPVALAITSKGETAYNNMPAIATDILGMMSAKLNGETPTESSDVAALITAGGGYCVIPVMNIPGAYLNSYNSADIVARSEGISNNATASQTPASTTKTMTMLCALAIAADLTEVLTVKPGDISSGSGTTFYSGDKVTLEDAIKIMMMESSNTMAEMVGRIIGGKLLTMEAKRSAV